MLDLSDATYLIAYLLLGGSVPPAPFPECGSDPGAGFSVLCRNANACL